MAGRFDTTTVNIALTVLRAVLPRCANHNVGTIEVRLALRVLRRHVPDCEALTTFWLQATSAARHPWESGHQAYSDIVGSLKRAGLAIMEENDVR
jgi:hypothetical protein